MSVDAQTVFDLETTVREDERQRLAAALEEHAEIIGDFAADAHRAVLLVAHLLRHHSTNPALAPAADALHVSR